MLTKLECLKVLHAMLARVNILPENYGICLQIEELENGQ